MKHSKDETPSDAGKEPNAPLLTTAFFLPLIFAAAYLNMGPTCCGCPPPPPDFTVSRTTEGVVADGASIGGFISADGRMTAFSSFGDNLGCVTTQANVPCLYLHSLATRETTNVPLLEPSLGASDPVLAYFGQIVVFAEERVLGGIDIRLVGLFDRAGLDETIASGLDGIGPNIYPEAPSMSVDGRFVVFVEEDGSLDATDTNGVADVYLKDRQTGDLTRVSMVNPLQPWGAPSHSPQLSSYGERLVYQLTTTGLFGDQIVLGDPHVPASIQAFSGTSPSMDSDATRIAYQREVGGDDFDSIFVFDASALTHEKVSIDSLGSPSTGHCDRPIISGDSRFVAFHCDEPMTSHGAFDQVYVRDLVNETTKLASINATGEPANQPAIPTSFSSTGTVLIIESAASNLGQDSGGFTQVFYVRIGYWDEGCIPTGADETACDGIDDDCDGEFDEDFVPQSTSCGIGACMSTGTTTCSNGTLGDSCTPLPGPPDTNCDGVDDDCDGAPDDDFIPQSTSCGIGSCMNTGTTTCSNGTLGDSCTPLPATPDTDCDGADDDCDGQTDEDYVSQGTNCGVGACAATGVTSCNSGQVADSCVPGTPGVGDVACDGIDEDCDGTVDEDAIGQVTCQIGGCLAVVAGPCNPSPDCAGEGVCISELACADATDNDGDGLVDCWDSDCSTSADCANTVPTLNPVAPQQVTVGDILRFTLAGSDPDGDPVTFSATPLPLPANATLEGDTGEFTFAPTLAQVSSFALDFSASDGRETTTQTTVITVLAPEPGGPTGVKGWLYDAVDAAGDPSIQTPVVGATIRDLGSSAETITAADGSFMLTGLTPGQVTLEFDGGTAPPPAPNFSYGSYRATKTVETGTILTLSQPVYVPHVDESTEVTVDPNTTTMLSNPTILVDIEIMPHTVMDELGGEYTGELTLSSVPPEFTPGALPDTLNPATVVTIQPMGLMFAQPAPITFPNELGLTAGSEVDIWSLDHSTGQFFVAGTGQVTSDGLWIETIAGGVQETSWHFPSPSGPGADDQEDGAGDSSDSDGGSGDDSGGPPDPCAEDVASRVPLAKGTVRVDVPLPSYTVLNQPVTPTLVYNTTRAHPVPLVSVNAFTIKRFAVPDVISYSASLGGVDLGGEWFLSPAGFSETVDEPFQVVVPVDAVAIDTSVVPLTVRLTSHYGDSSVSTDVERRLPVVNGRGSAFGVGWGWKGLRRLVQVGDGGVDRLMVDGSGAYRLFTFNSGQFLSPSGDATLLTANGDGTMVLRSTDGTETHFDSEGKQERVVLANGNTWSYFYDPAGLLTDVVDPIGGLTTLHYAGGMLSSVIDPADRSTGFQHDASGHLVQVDLPDQSSRRFGYDSQGLMTSETDARDFTKYRKFDFTGRLTEVVLEDTSSRFISVAATQGLVDPASGIGLSKDNPAPITTAAAATTTIDAEGRTRTYEFNQYGTVERFVDAASLTTTMEYDEDGNVVRIVRPSGASRVMTYDANHNLLSETDDQLGGTTQYTYDPLLSRLESITDANQEDTILGYNALGQVISVTTPLQREITMTYTPEGNLDTLNGPLGVQTSFQYDASGNLIQIARAADAQVRATVFTNDAAGNVDSRTDAADRIVAYTHDPMNRVTSVQGPGSPVTQLAYDAEGNNTVVTPPSQPSHRFEYDERDWLSSYLPPSAGGATAPMTFARNAEGQETVVTRPDGRPVSRSYDAAGRLMETIIQRGSYSISYSPLTGLVNQMTDPSGAYLTFAHVGDRLQRVASSSGTAVEYGYDSLGRLATLSLESPQASCSAGSGVVASYLADGDAVDSVGGHDGTILGPVGYTDGVNGQAFDFGGVQQRIRATVPMWGETSASLSAWFRLFENDPTDSITRLLDVGGDFRISLVAPAEIISGVGAGWANVYASVTPYKDGEWHHVVAAMDESALNVYYDGELVGSDPMSSFALTPSNNLFDIGRFDQFFLGDVDLVTVYNRALHPAEVAQIYSARSPWSCVDQLTVSYAYDEDGAMIQAGDILMGYNPGTGLLETRTLAQLTTTRGHNGFGEVVSELTEAVGVPDALYDVTHVRDPLGRISAKTETVGGQTKTLAYQYDDAGRLQQVLQAPATELESYTYDDNGNRLTATNQFGSFTASYDDQDRLLSYGPNQYTYRDSGELLQKTHTTDGTTSYDYDELGNLLSVALPGGSVVEYEIDAMNRRVGRRFDGQVTHRWVYKDQLNPVAELDADGVMVSLFTYGARSHVPDAMTKDGVRYLFVTDQVGSVRLVVNAETGAVVQQIDYDAWGNVIADTSPGFQPFGFAGGLYDGQTKLVRFGARDYDPEVGRWTAKDPTLFDGGQANLYLYVGADPVNRFDPSGLVDACVAAIVACTSCAYGVASVNPFSAFLGCLACGNAQGGFATCNDGDGPECAPPPAGCRLKGPGTGPGNPCQVICDPVCEEGE